MKNINRYPIVLFIACFAFFNATCQVKKLSKEKQTIMPASDPSNKGGWILNKEISDEFEGDRLDTTKWFIEGQNGDYYIWKGRAPSQFAPHNVIVENGKLKLRTQWEPDYPFVQESYADGGNKDTFGVYGGKPMPITTAGVITKKRFLNGYMEVRSKVGNAAITGAFWAIGYEQELDVYELMGKPKIDGDIKPTTFKATIHDWSPPAVRPTHTYTYKNNKLPFKVADEFHVFGAEWGENYLKLFLDGKMVDSVHQNQLGTDWVLNNPMEVWLDSEIFKWLGVPHKEELPVDFEIDYLRVWQKPNNNLLDRAFYGFEGPILYENNPRPLTLVPESSVPDNYQKFWLIDTTSAKYFSIVKGEYASGVNSLQFSGFGKNEKLNADKIVALSPKGAVNVPAGEYTLSLKVWLDQGHVVKNIYLSLADSKMEIPIDLTGVERRKWVTIEKKISILNASGPNDQFKIEIRKNDVPKEKAAKLFIDDIAILK